MAEMLQQDRKLLTCVCIDIMTILYEYFVNDIDDDDGRKILQQ